LHDGKRCEGLAVLADHERRLDGDLLACGIVAKSARVDNGVAHHDGNRHTRKSVYVDLRLDVPVDGAVIGSILRGATNWGARK
jgi:hypothetical protein